MGKNYKDHANQIGEDYYNVYQRLEWFGFDGRHIARRKKLPNPNRINPQKFHQMRNRMLAEERLVKATAMYVAFALAPGEAERLEVAERMYAEARNQYHKLNRTYAGAETDIFGFVKGTTNTQKQQDFDQYVDHVRIISGWIAKAFPYIKMSEVKLTYDA